MKIFCYEFNISDNWVLLGIGFVILLAVIIYRENIGIHLRLIPTYAVHSNIKIKI